MAANSTISFARGAPSLDIVDVEGLREAAQQAFTDDPGGTVAYGTSVGYVPLREWIAEQHGVAVEQVLVTNGSMQADAFLFQLMVAPGRRRGRRVADLRPHAAQPAQQGRGHPHGRRWRPTGSTRRRWRRCSRRHRPQARPHHPQLPEPGGLHAVGGQARDAAAARRRARLHAVRGRPVHRDPLRGRVAADDALPGRRRARSSTPRRSPRRSARASASATSSGRRR